MAEQLVLAAQRREGGGGGVAKRLRKAGSVPGVIYSNGAAAESLQVDAHAFGMILQHHGESMILKLDIDGLGERLVVLKAVQHHPVSGRILHADFQEISMTEKLETHVPIHLTGEAEGVKLGGILDQSLFELEIAGLPVHIPESIDVDVSALAIGDHLTVADIRLDATLDILSDPELAVASVLMPRLEEEAEGEGGAEPEVIGEKDKKDED